MPLTLPTTSEPPALPVRLQRLFSRFRRTVILRQGSRIALLFIASIAVFTALDWKYHLPPLVRGLELAAALAVPAALFAYRIMGPLQRERDILAMAQRVERLHPELNDALLSAIQFLELPEARRFGSEELRQETIDRAIADTEDIDFDRAVSSRGLRRSLLAFLAALSAACWAVATLAPAETALERLLIPFGSTVWPANTTIEIVSPRPLPHRMARGDAFDLLLKVHGVIPERARIGVWLDGASPSEMVVSIPKSEQAPEESSFSVRIEPNRVPRGFRFRVRAGDADTDWQSVLVLPPPALVPRDGRPSPQIHLDFPAYTQLPALDLPDGGSVIEAVTGTEVRIAAAADRPLAHARLEYHPEQAALPLAALLSSIASRNPLEGISSLQLTHQAWGEIPVRLSSDRQLIDIEFVPWLPGPYRLHIEDESGLAAHRYFDLRVQTDPSPVVDWSGHFLDKEPQTVLADAEITLAALAQDKIFALRNVFVEYKVGRSGVFQQVGCYDSEFIREAIPGLSALAHMPLALPVGPIPRLRQYSLGRRMPVAMFTHADGSRLKEGDLLILRVGATDYDDVTFGKPPGYSSEIELQIVSKAHLEAALQQKLSQMRNELLLLHDQQRDARTRVIEALKQLQDSGQLQRTELERLGQAEMQQQQIQARIAAAEDGLLARLARMKQSIEDNKLPRSATTQRVEAVESDLDRLAKEELGPIEPLIGVARKEQQKGPNSAAQPSLARAERHQKEVEETLKSVLERLEPWSGAGEVRGEARSILSELRKQLELLGQLQQEQKPGTVGGKRDDLTPEMRAELDRASIRPERQADRIRQLLEKMERLADEKNQAAADKLEKAKGKQAEAKALDQKAGQLPKGGPEEESARKQAAAIGEEARALEESGNALKAEGEALRNALKKGDAQGLRQQTQDVPRQIRENQLGDARANLNTAGQQLEQMVEALTDRGKPDAENNDELRKKRKAAEGRLDKLLDEQERLQKKIDAAAQIADPAQRALELQKLAREQKKLEQEARDLAQQLTRLNADPAAQELHRAARQMEEDGQQLEQGQPPANPEEALDKLDEAQEKLGRERERSEEELIREQLAKAADMLRGLRERQQSALEEEKRLHAKALAERAWKLAAAKESLPALIDQQSSIAKEVRGLIDKRFSSAPVFSRMLRQSAVAMEDAVKRLELRKEDVLDQIEGIADFNPELEKEADQGIRSRQELALKRLDQLLESLKPDKEMLRPQPKNGQNGPKQPDEANTKPNDSLPPLAQLKALRELQSDIAQRTAAFDMAHPDRSRLTASEAADLELLKQAQVDVAELVQELTAAASNGEQP